MQLNVAKEFFLKIKALIGQQLVASSHDSLLYRYCILTIVRFSVMLRNNVMILNWTILSDWIGSNFESFEPDQTRSQNLNEFTKLVWNRIAFLWR